jgi:hypothetical protein
MFCIITIIRVVWGQRWRFGFGRARWEKQVTRSTKPAADLSTLFETSSLWFFTCGPQGCLFSIMINMMNIKMAGK